MAPHGSCSKQLNKFKTFLKPFNLFFFGLKETVVQMAKAKGAKWYGACVEEWWLACFEKGVGVWSEGQEEARTTKEDMEDANGEGEMDAMTPARWKVGVGEIAVRVG